MVSYFAPSLSFNAWCESNELKFQKSLFPYDWLNSQEKLKNCLNQSKTFLMGKKCSRPKRLGIKKEEYKDFLKELRDMRYVTMRD